MRWCDVYERHRIQQSAFRRVRNVTIARVSITAHQPASVCGRLQDHGVIALGIHPLSGIEVVGLVEFLIVTLRRTSQGVSRKHLSTVCVKSIAAKISLVRLLTTSE